MTEKNQTLVALAGVSVLGAILQQVCDPTQVKAAYWNAGTSLITLFFVFRWYALDAKDLAFERNRLLDVLVVGAALLVLPWYFFRTRGALGGLRATIVGFIGVVALATVDWAAAHGVYLIQVHGM